MLVAGESTASPMDAVGALLEIVKSLVYQRVGVVSALIKGQIYHVDLNISDFTKSAEFYEGFLGWLGYRRIGYWAKHGVAGWGIEGCNLWINQRTERFAQYRFHRKNVGLNHIAFHADSRDTVDRFYREYLQPKKIPVLYGGPKDYPDYSKGYYAVYFEDPDRIKLELAYVPDTLRVTASSGKSSLKEPIIQQ